jgi:hypothetical protein
MLERARHAHPRVDQEQTGEPFVLTSPQSALFFETPQQIFARVFAELKPRTAAPPITVRFVRYTAPNSNIRLRAGAIDVRISDLLEGAPSPVVEALAQILLGKLFRRPVPRVYTHRYRLYLNRRDMRRQAHLMRQIRGRKMGLGPRGEYYNLEEIFEELNTRFFDGLLARPLLHWSVRVSRTRLGHFDPSHHAIIISRIFDSPRAGRLALEYVVFHEMLHLRHPVDHRGARRRVHTREFHEDEKKFPGLALAKEMLKKL